MAVVADRRTDAPVAQAYGGPIGTPRLRQTSRIVSSIGQDHTRISTGPGSVIHVVLHLTSTPLFQEESLDFQAEKPEETLAESLAAYAAMAASLPKREFDEDFDLPYL